MINRGKGNKGKRGHKKIALYLPPTEGAFFGSLIRAGANWIAGRHKDSINLGLDRAARAGMFGRRRDPTKPRKDRVIRNFPTMGFR